MSLVMQPGCIISHTRNTDRLHDTEIRDSLPIKKFKTFHSVCKITAMVSWDAEGVLLVDFLPRGEMINVAHYCNMLDKEKLFHPTGQHGSTFMSSFFMTM